jgi:hypothetical protein
LLKPDLCRAVEEFATTPKLAAGTIRQLFDGSDAKAFVEAAIPPVRTAPERPGAQFLLSLLLFNDLIFAPLANPGIFSLEQATAVAKQLLKIEPLLDVKMVRRLLESTATQDEAQKRVLDTIGVRVLEIMAAISDGARLLPQMTRLSRHSNLKIRSKAALLVGRSNKNCRWVQQCLEEADPRVRANAVESLWDVNSVEAKSIFWAAINDPDSRVIGNALLGLFRLGDSASLPLIFEMLAHAGSRFRLTAGDPQFLAPLARIISDPDPQIRAAVFRSMAKLKQAEAKGRVP